MFSTEVFIADGINFLHKNNYTSYEEAKEDIILYIRFKLPTEFNNQKMIDYLTGMILINYIELEYKLNPHVIININDNDCNDDNDGNNDIYHENIYIWVAAAEFAV